MADQLKDRNVAILVANGYEQVELTEPLKRLSEEGASVDVVSIEKDQVKGWQKGNWGETRDVDVHIDNAVAGNYDALVLPGGQMNPDNLRADLKAVKFVKEFFLQHKPVAAICHGPWILINAEVVQGRTMTSYHSIKTDLVNAGALWRDEEVVVDEGLVTSRNPDDLPAFNDQMVKTISKGEHALQH